MERLRVPEQLFPDHSNVDKMCSQPADLEKFCYVALASRAFLIGLALLMASLIAALYLLHRSMVRMKQLEMRIAKLENDMCCVGTPSPYEPKQASYSSPREKYLGEDSERAGVDVPSHLYFTELRQSHSRTNSLASNPASNLDQETDADSRGEGSPLFLPRTRSMGELNTLDLSQDAQSHFHWVSGAAFARTESNISHQTGEFEPTIASMRTRSFSVSGQEDSSLPRSNSWTGLQDRSPLGRMSRRSPTSSEALPSKRGPLRKYSASSSSGARFYAKIVDRRG
mmetsp:Transcript_27550/g.62516  ORF Transcript_27550/g.62516 Transcript_27550/m.62516 type:complete len:283 (+) Transcript_27550:406-1254(+)|eukprot:749230-Hanusia_phi.AAC.3